MPGVILTFLEYADSVPRLLAACEQLSERLGGARIDVLAVRVPPEANFLPTEEVMTPHHAAMLTGREQDRILTLRAAFAPWAERVQREGVSVRWCEEDGEVDQNLQEWGRRADVIVLRRPEEIDQLPAQTELHTALFGTDRPVLVVPPGMPTNFGRRVAVAWRDDRHATRAVLSALRCQTPPEKVFVLTGVRPGEPPPSVPDILLEHGIEPELYVLPIGPGVFGEALLAKAHALRADMIVMGAYRHSPIREFLLGGVTRYMLTQSDLPVLMRH